MGETNIKLTFDTPEVRQVIKQFKSPLYLIRCFIFGTIFIGFIVGMILVLLEKGLKTVSTPDTTENILKVACEGVSGKWLESYRECENVKEKWCLQMGGKYQDCDSACRHEPEVVCITVCVPVCKF